MVYRPPLPMVYRPPYPWYIDPLNHGILTPYPWYIDPPTHGISTPYPWHIDPLNHGISTPLPMVYWPPYQLKRLSKQVNLCLYRESQRNQFWEQYQIWYTNLEILKIFLKFYENFEFFFNLMKYVSFEILWKFCNFLKFLKYRNWNFFEKFSIFFFFFLKFYKIVEILNFFENLDFWEILKFYYPPYP